MGPCLGESLPILGVPSLHPAASVAQDGASPFPAGMGSGGWWRPRCPAGSATSPAAAWPRSGTGKCWEGSIAEWGTGYTAPPQTARPTPRPNPGHHTGTSYPIFARGLWSSAGVREAAWPAGVAQDTHTCAAAPELSPLPRSWGAGCPCPAGTGSASARALCRWLYEGVSRQKAEELLLRPGNHSGSFLIRESQTRRGESPRSCSPSQPSGAPVVLILHLLHLVATAPQGSFLALLLSASC